MGEQEGQHLQKSQILKYEDFELLRCDKCKEYLNCPPIMVYRDPIDLEKSYTECGRCYSKSTKSNFPEAVRNVSAETLAAVTAFPCRYYAKGCREYRIWPKINLHEQQCMFRVFEGFLLDNISTSLTGKEIIQKYDEEYPHLILHNSLIPFTFDKDFEQPYLVHQNTDLFTCKVKYDAEAYMAWFTVTLLEKRNNTECYIEFSCPETKQSVTIQIVPTSDITVVDMKAINALFCNNSLKTKCKVYINKQLLMQDAHELLKDIECPSCWNYMNGRIYLCTNGHSTCSECKKQLQSCPVCREVEVTATRNFSLEKVISQAYFPCKNNLKGCSYISILDEIMCHQSYCKFECD